WNGKRDVVDRVQFSSPKAEAAFAKAERLGDMIEFEHSFRCLRRSTPTRGGSSLRNEALWLDDGVKAGDLSKVRCFLPWTQRGMVLDAIGLSVRAAGRVCTTSVKDSRIGWVAPD